jgi:hypothetical protein
MARTPLLQPQFGLKYAVIFCFGFLVKVGRNLSVSSFRKLVSQRAGSEYARRFPHFKLLAAGIPL